MLTIPENTFFGNVSWPSGKQMALDPYQYTGASIHTDGSCQELFGTRFGPQYCAPYCMNTCPMLNPDPVAGAQESIAQSQTLLTYVQPAIAAANVAVTTMNARVTISGLVDFVLPQAASAAVVAAVMNDIQVKVAASLPTPMTLRVSLLFCFHSLFIFFQKTFF